MALAVIAGTILLPACAQLFTSGGGGEVESQSRPACPSFRLSQEVVTIDVGTAGGTFDLGFDNQLVFERGAVTGRATYEVRAGGEDGGRRLAAVRIDPGGDAPTEFQEPVTIRLSYGVCPFSNTSRPLWLVSDDGGGWQRVGGAKSQVGRYVKADVNQFSAFAIAM